MTDSNLPIIGHVTASAHRNIQFEDFAEQAPLKFYGGEEHYAPRWIAIINGYAVEPIDQSVELYAHGETDTATVTVSLADMPDWSVQLADSLAQDGSVPIEIRAGFPADPDAVAPANISELAQVFLGVINDWEPNWLANEVTFSARSFISILTAAKITTTASGQRSTDFVRAVGARYGFRVVIGDGLDANAATMAQVFGKELVVGLRDARVWDVLQSCAEADGARLYGDGMTLYYVATDDNPEPAITLLFGRDFNSFSGKHSPQYNKNIKVDVRVSNPKRRHAIHQRTKTVNGKPVTTVKVTDTFSHPIFGGNGSSSFSIDSKGNTSSNTSTSSGGVQQTGSAGFSNDDGKEHYILRIPYADLAYANARRLTFWNQLSRAEYQITFEVTATPETVAALKRGAVFDVENVPWTAFNSTSSERDVTSGGASGSSGPITLSGVAPPKRYRAQSIKHRMSTPQGDDPAGDSDGWAITVEAINHELPQLGL